MDKEDWEDCNRVYTAEKAGMDSVDKDYVKRTIYELSKVNVVLLWST